MPMPMKLTTRTEKCKKLNEKPKFLEKYPLKPEQE